MTGNKIIKYWRFLMQGVAMASWGTMAITPSWGGFVLGLICSIFGFAYSLTKKEINMAAPMIATIVTVCVIGIAVLIYAIRKAH